MRLGLPPQQIFAYTGGRRLDPGRPCLVFLHGAQQDHSVWTLQSRYLAHHGFGVLALDLPGHGRSDGPVLDSVEEMGARIAQALRELELQRLVLIGHSMGSLIALEVARQLTERVVGVALCGTAFPMRVSEELLAATRNDPAAAIEMINVWSHRPSIAPFIARPSSPGPGFSIVWGNLRLMQRIARTNGSHVLANDFAACNAYGGGLEAINALHCPVLFVLGEADSMTLPKFARGLIEGAANGRVVSLPDTGHAMMAENPEGVRRALTEFAHAVTAATAA
jgi:pimeloyl-ACP methyl ester carboxylesterase